MHTGTRRLAHISCSLFSFFLIYSSAHASILSADILKRYKSANDIPVGTAVSSNGGKVKIYDYGVGETAVLGPGAGNETITWRHTSPTGVAYEGYYAWDSANECWIKPGGSVCYAVPEFNATSWMAISGGGWTKDDLGQWQFELLLNGSPYYSEPWTLVSPALLMSNGNGQTGVGGTALATPFEVRLVEDDGVTPLTNESVNFTISSAPKPGRTDTSAYLSSDGGDNGTRPTSLSAITDPGGYARIYLVLGTKAGSYSVTAKSQKAPFDSQVFSATAVASLAGGGPADDQKNNGSAGPCVQGVGQAGAAGDPINIVTGNKYESQQDIVMSSPSRLEFTRYYNSKDTTSGVLGWNWRHSYSGSVTVVTSGKGKTVTQTAYVKRPDGKQYAFQSVNGAWVGDPDVSLTLKAVANGWEIKHANVTEQYDSTGQLLSISDIDGRMIQLTYAGPSGALSRVSDDVGAYIDFFYDANARLQKVRDPAQREWQFAYDAAGNLTTATNPDQTTRQYHYEDPRFAHALTGITDERAVRYATWAYDANGMANTSYLAGNAGRVDITYNSDGSRVATNSRGYISTYQTTANYGTGLVTAIDGPGCSTCGTADATLTYDSQTNKLLGTTVKGIQRTYGGYLGNDKPGYVIEGVGTPDERRTDYSYDPRFKDLPVIEQVAAVSGWTNQYALTQKTYDDFGSVIQEVRSGYTPDGQALTPRQTNYIYNGPAHQLSQVDGPRTDIQDIWTFDYYPNDAAQGSNRAHLKRITGPGGLVLADNIQYTATGKKLSEQRLNGLQLTYTYYPGNDRLESVTESDGSASHITRWTYLPTGEVETITVAADTADATTLAFEYDDARRLTGILDGLGNLRRFVLNTEGDVESEESYDNAGTLKASIGRIFDEYNRLQQTTAANEVRHVVYGADGRISETVDGNSSGTTYGYDGLKRITSTTQLVDGTNRTTSLTYNANNDVTSVTQPNGGHVTSYAVDDFGDVDMVTSPDMGVTTYAHDAAGNLISAQDALGRASTLQYDALDRLLGLDADGTLDDRIYAYDSCVNGAGKLCSIQNGYATVTYAYDSFGNVTAHQGVGYEHDAAGRISAITYTSGTRVQYGYDASGQVSTVYANGPLGAQYLASGITYEPFGPVHGLTYGNGLPYSATFDQAVRPVTESSTGALGRSYTNYDGNGNLLAVTDQVGSAAAALLQFAYYQDDSLDLAQGPFGSRDYDYDPNGNRTQVISDTQTFPYARYYNNNQVNLIGTAPYLITPGLAAELGMPWCQSAVECWMPGTNYKLDIQYNNVGNQTSRADTHYQCVENTYNDPLYGLQPYYACSTTGQTAWGYSYSAFNQMTQVTADSIVVANYEYNGLGQRSRKVLADGTATRYVYGLKGELLAETDDAGAVRKEYVYLNDRLLAVNDLIANRTYYVHTDHLGTPKVLTGQAGQILWTADHDPFGAATVNEDPDGDGVNVTLNVRFPGQYFDAETGLHYNYFRYYDPVTGRYTTSDPIGLRGGLNTYAYTFNDPINWIDEYGLARNVLGSPPESHNGGKEHVHWGPEKNPRQNAVNKDGTIRHGKEPPRSIKDLINRKFGWTLEGPFILLPFSPEELDHILPKPYDPLDGVPPDC